MPSKVSRRRFLRGSGVLLALPMLEAMHPALIAKTSKPETRRRFVCLSNNYGVYPEAFFPTAEVLETPGDLPETLQPLEEHWGRFTVFSHLDHGNTGGHQGVPVLLSGVRPHMAFDFPEGNLSIDQKIAESIGSETRFSAMALQVNEANLVSFTRTGVQVPGIDLRQAFRALFVDEEGERKASAAERLRRHRSILDVVREEARSIERDLGRQDLRKFQEYMEAVRSLETKIERLEPWIDRPKPESPQGEPAGGRGTDADLKAMMELIALAIETDSTRAITVTSGFTNGDYGFSGSYHGFSHHGQRDMEVRALKAIERGQMSQLAYLATLLAGKTDPIDGGTLLDRTAILFGCGMATGEHSTRNLPLVLVGGSFRHQGHLKLPHAGPGRVPAANLLLSILRHQGIEAEQFGTSRGTVPGLEWSES